MFDEIDCTDQDRFCQTVPYLLHQLSPSPPIVQELIGCLQYVVDLTHSLSHCSGRTTWADPPKVSGVSKQSRLVGVFDPRPKDRAVKRSLDLAMQFSPDLHLHGLVNGFPRLP
jgi:hypothetical protein